MSLGSIVVSLLKGKIVAAALVGITVAGGATAAMAMTPLGQRTIHTITTAQGVASHSEHASLQAGQNEGKTAPPNTAANTKGSSNTCPGLSDAQRLAASFSLSNASNSDDVMAICTLHNGTFKGTAPNGAVVSSDRNLGYGEINLLLTYAQYLASHNTASATGKLTSENVRIYLAAALQKCGATAVMACVKSRISGFQPGNATNSDGGNAHASGNSNRKGDGSGNGSGGGKPTSTTTPHH